MKKILVLSLITLTLSSTNIYADDKNINEGTNIQKYQIQMKKNRNSFMKNRENQGSTPKEYKENMNQNRKSYMESKKGNSETLREYKYKMLKNRLNFENSKVKKD